MASCQMQSDNLYVASSHIGSTATKKSRVVPARCMYTLVLAPCSNCGGPLCNGTFSTGFFGLVNEPAKPSKTVGRFQQELHFAPTVTAESCRHNERFLSAQVRLLFQAYLVVLYRPKQGGRQGTAWRSSTLQDVRQNPSPALKESPRMGTEFGCKICMLCADSLQISVSKFSHCVHMCVCILRFQSVLASVCVDSNYCPLVFCLLCSMKGN